MWHGTDPNIERIRSVSNCQLSDATGCQLWPGCCWRWQQYLVIFWEKIWSYAVIWWSVTSSVQGRPSPSFLYTIININAQMAQFSSVFDVQPIRFTGVRQIFSPWWPPLVVSIAECCQLSGEQNLFQPQLSNSQAQAAKWFYTREADPYLCLDCQRHLRKDC